MEDVSHLTGEKQLGVSRMILNEVRFNGQTGKFVKVNLVDKKEGVDAETVELGDEIKAVFLKIRRRLGGFDSAKDAFLVSTEHNTKDDVVQLFGVRDKGIAEALYEKYKPVLKAQRVIYAWILDGRSHELVRIIVKGASLLKDREEQANESTSLLDYLNKEKASPDDHVYKFVTEMKAVEKKGKLGKYYAIDFSQGKRIADDKLEEAIAEIKRLHEYSLEQDKYNSTATPAVETKSEYPVNDDAEIPF